jgi:hypothetical protein
LRDYGKGEIAVAGEFTGKLPFIPYIMIYRKYTVNITVPVNSSSSKGIDGVSDEDSHEDIARSHAKVIAKAS